MQSEINIPALRKEYKSRSLEKEDLTTDPQELFSIWFKEAHLAGESEPNAMALATVSSEGMPSVRMVLLKGLEEGGYCFYTNYHSQKGIELLQNPKAAILFWWQTIERQIRISGVVHKINSYASDQYFDSRPEGSRLGAIASPQSQIINDRSILEQNYQSAADKSLLEGKISRPDHWGGFVLIPEEYEFWQGRENRMHDRFRYNFIESSWSAVRLAP